MASLSPFFYPSSSLPHPHPVPLALVTDCGSGRCFWAPASSGMWQNFSSYLSPDPDLRPDYPKQQEDRREKRGVSKAFPGRGFLKHPVLPLKALFHLLLSPTAHFSEAKADRTQKAWEGGNGDWGSSSSSICCILGVQGSELPSVVSSKPTKTTVHVRVSLVEKSN